MSARVLVLLTTTAAALALTGCGSDTHLASAAPTPGGHPVVDAPAAQPDPDSPEAGPAKPKTKPKGNPKAAAAEAKDGTDLGACLDATCEVEVSDGQEIPLDGRHGADSIAVKVRGDQVTFTMRNKGSKATTTQWLIGSNAVGGTSVFNGIRLTPRKGPDGKVIVDISHD
ncbi:hypothetical protein [Actinomadura sp. NEAU-AAG7]|uniref:hypothetical protein n=1 Tax=Actinomadura sp. NEAU-AAG7 TaxID=2839640 RepID=UPI001BE4AFDD|nr:hypothetical protein [Actinomadura sp. NEAU-AAG7]MBT2210643.1 hypothetical protein [Actinomadura sp. NEAU-AAG7]